MSECKVCGADPCPIGGTEQPPPFTSVRVDGEPWVNIPASLNWNWYSPAQGGMWCWEDLEHATWPGVPERVEVTYRWGCDGCGGPWPFFDPAGAAHILVPGRAGSGVLCPHCRDVEWPRALGVLEMPGPGGEKP